jgi:hypothetical protein
MRITRSLAALAAAATVAGLVASPAGAATNYDPKPSASGSRWMAGQLTDGIVHNQQFDFDDYGLTIDFALGLDGAGRKPRVVQQITQAFAPNVSSYTGFMGDVYAGNLGKAAVLALVTGKDPRAFGGQDLIAQLEDRVSSTAPITGRIEDVSSFGDSANVFGQAHAARALSLAGSARSGDTTAFLLQQQCAAGFFRQDFTADKALPDQSCDGAPTASKPSVDATALAVLSLKDVKGAKAKAAMRKAVAWLADNQRGNGSFSSKNKAKGKSNTNSTGLAGWALGVNANAKAAARAAVWVRNLQAGGANPCSGRLARQTGAIALDQAGYATGQSDGIKALTSDQWRRASAQALPVLRWAPRAEGDFTAKAPRTAPAGSRLRIELTGVAPGERVCVKDGKFSFEFRSGRNATRHVTFIINGSPGLRTFKVFVGSKRRDVTVKVTG